VWTTAEWIEAVIPSVEVRVGPPGYLVGGPSSKPPVGARSRRYASAGTAVRSPVRVFQIGQSGVVWVLNSDNSPQLIRQLGRHARTFVLEVVCVGEGWRSLVEQCHRELEEHFPDYELLAVKETEGHLAFQAFAHPWEAGEPWTPEEWERVGAITGSARARSEEVCEWCGSPGSFREERTHYLTLCDACNDRFADPPWGEPGGRAGAQTS
jgi:hypothetical protein